MITATPPDNALILQWIFGGFVVFLYARDRFRSPHTVRATTTFWRYWSAWTGYIMAMLALFIVLGGGFTSQNLAHLLTTIGPTEGNPVNGLPPGPLLSALVLTVLLPHFPLLGKIDEAVMQWFRRVGNIPLEVRLLGGQLRESTFAPGAEALKRLAPVFNAYHASAQWLQEPSHPVRHLYARSVAIYGQIETWEHARGFARFFDENRDALADVRKRLEDLSVQLDEVVLSELEKTEEVPLAVAMRRSTGDSLGALHRTLCDFASGAVLHGGWSRNHRMMLLRQLGFTNLPETRGPLSVHDIVLVAGLIFIVMLFVPLAVRRFIDPTVLPMKARVIVMVPVIYAISIVVAIYPKSVWPFAARPATGERPFAAYALSGAVAAVAAFGISLLFRFVFENPGNILYALATPGGFDKAWTGTLRAWPWLLMTMLGTIAIAWAADDAIHLAGTPPPWLRTAETLALAAAYGLLQWLVVELLTINFEGPGTAGKWRERLPQMIATSVLIGGCIGAFIPHVYRRRACTQPPARMLPVALAA